MIDFKELPQNGDDFEFLIRDILYNKGLEVYWSGKGADGGKDLLCIEKQDSNFKATEKRWVIQCKHNAHANRAVNPSDIDDVAGVCDEHNATGYLLVCSTYPSSALVRRLEEIQKNKNITISFWDSRYIERELMKPQNWDIANLYFPITLSKMGWRISTITPYFWHANYNGNIFYMAARIGNYNYFLQDIQDRLNDLKQIKKPKDHIIRLRAAYFDDKYTNYKLYIDYLIPINEDENMHYLDQTVKQFEKFDIIEGVSYEFDIMTYRYNYASDNFDQDHQTYYNKYLDTFKYGGSRDGKRTYVYDCGDNSSSITESEVSNDFNNLCNTIESIDFITILKRTNAKIEFIDQFTENFTWNSIITSAAFDIDNFFDCQIRFECNDFNKLKCLVNFIPQSVSKHFHLDKNYIIVPDDGFEEDEDAIFTLHFTVHPAQITSKIQFRKFLNQYLREVKDGIDNYIKIIANK